MNPQYPIVLVTGASTGIGRATALHLAACGYFVMAGVRSELDRESFAAVANLEAVLLDVTSEEHIGSVAAQIARKSRGLFALINNAGHNYNAPFEHTDEAKARAMMEVNFFGLYRLTQQLIPQLRQGAAHAGTTSKIINVSSIGGLFGLPWESFYHASKFAVMGLTESLRHELWRQNIRAVALCPGGIRTEFMPKTEVGIQAAIAALPTTAKPLYESGMRTLARRIALSAKYGSPAELVAKKVAALLAARHPPFRKLVGLDACLLAFTVRLLPFSWYHRLFGALFGQ